MTRLSLRAAPVRRLALSFLVTLAIAGSPGAARADDGCDAYCGNLHGLVWGACKLACPAVLAVEGVARSAVDAAINALAQSPAQDLVDRVKAYAQSVVGTVTSSVASAVSGILGACSLTLPSPLSGLGFDAAGRAAQLHATALDQATRSLRNALQGALGKVNEAFQRLMSGDIDGAKNKAAEVASGPNVGAWLGTAKSAAAGFLNAVEDAVKREADAFKTLDLGAVVRTAISSALKNAGDGVLERVFKCAYEKLLAPAFQLSGVTTAKTRVLAGGEGAGIAGAPDPDSAWSWVKAARELFTRLMKGPGTLTQNLGALAGDVSDRALDALTSGVTRLFDAHQRLHALLADPEKTTPADVKEFVRQNLSGPLVAQLKTALTDVLPQTFVDALAGLADRLLAALGEKALGLVLVIRKKLQDAFDGLLPALLEGANGVAAVVGRLPSFLGEGLRKRLLSAAEKMKHAVTPLVTTLFPDLTETVVRVLDSVGGAADSVNGALATWRSALGKTPASATLRDVVGAISRGPGSASSAVAKTSPAASDPAKKQAQDAHLAARLARRAAVRESVRATILGRLRQSPPPSLTSTASAPSASTSDADAARRAAESDDPKLAMERALGSVSDRLADGFMEAVFDPLVEVHAYAMSLYAQGLDVFLGVLGAVLSAVPYTTTYGPLIVSVMQVVYDVGLNATRFLLHSLLAPEGRQFIDEWLHNDLRRTLLRMWRSETVRRDPASALTAPKRPAQKQIVVDFLKNLSTLMTAAEPLVDGLKSWRDELQAGLAGFLEGPIGKLFPRWPKPLVAALGKAIARALRSLREEATAQLIGLGKDFASDGSVSPERVGTAILAALQLPLVEFLTALVPNKPLSDALEASFRAAFKPDPGQSAADYVNPQKILEKTGVGIAGARDAIATFVVGDLAGLSTSSCQAKNLEALISGAVRSVGNSFATDGASALFALGDGLIGVLRGAAKALPKGLACALGLDLGDEQRAAIEALLGTLLDGPGAVPSELWLRGLPAILSGVMPALRGFVVDLVMKPRAGQAQAAEPLRASVLFAATRVLARPEAPRNALTKGLRGVAADVVSEAMGTLQPLLCRGLDAGCAASLRAKAGRWFGADAVLSGGLGAAIAAWAKETGDALAAGWPADAKALVAARASSMSTRAGQQSLAREGGGALLGGVVDAVKALGRVVGSDKGKRGAVRAVLAALSASPMRLDAVGAALSKLAASGLRLAGVR